ncbi:MAG: hypothetical protein R2702_05225 [Acidimicrobiales bacterium]
MSMTVEQSAAVLADLRRARRKQRVAAIHWVDALYQVYVTGIVSVVIIVLVSGWVGDGDVSAGALADVRDHGPAVMGLLVALAIFSGLRAGSRGGPLALEKPDVRHVLLSPVDRGVALRGPAWRQLRFLTAVGAAVGAVAGQLALRRLPGNPLEWLLVGAAFGVTVVGLGFGCALLASGLKLPGWAASLVGGLLLAWAAGDIVGSLPASPTSFVGALAVWPVHVDPLGALGPVLAGIAVLVGMRFVDGTSLEAAERRTALVGQMRFAVTLQDLRTVLVLRRQLAQEKPRSRPWIPAIRRHPRWPVLHRGVRSVARWPISRIVRVVLMAVIAGLSLRGVWHGTTPLVILAGIAMWVAALDAAEPLGQEIDHPGRTDQFPIERGVVFVRHLPITLLVSIATGLLAAAVAAAPFGDGVGWGPALVTGVALGMLAACGAVVSVVQGAPDPVDTLSMVTPEIAGTRTVYRTAFPPALAVAGTLPLIAARASVRGIQDPPPVPAAVNVTMVLTGVAVLVGGWVRFRDDIHGFMAEAAENMSPTKAAERMAEERRGEEEREADVLAESRRIAGLDDDGEDQGAGAAKRPPSRQARAKKPTAPSTPGVRGGTSAKPIGRRRDQK